MMVNKKKSLRITSILFYMWMVFIGMRKFNEIYILMKHSVVDLDVPCLVLYVVELCAFVAIGILLAKLMRNIQNQIIFDRKNVRMFKGMVIAALSPTLILVVDSFISDTSAYSLGHSVGSNIGYWITGFLFLNVITGIFQYGVQLKEEQDLTV